MIDAALYLSRRSFANALRRRLERLRQPKYLIGFCVGLLYFYWLIVRPGGAPRPPAGTTIPGSGVVSALGDVAAVAGLAVVLAFTWIFGSAETPFTFQLAETDFLFPAPLTRRQVIQFRLLRSQMPLLISAAFSVLIFSRGHFDARLPLRILGLWVMYLTLQLHTAGAAMVRGSLTQQGMTGIQRRLITLGVLAALLVGLWLGLRASLPGIVAAWRDDAEAGAAELARALHHGILGVVLWPLFALKGPLLAASVTQFLTRLPAALLVAGAHYVWVVRSTLAFEEAAVEHANKVARRIEARRRGRADVPRPSGAAPRTFVPLAVSGRPAAAIVWKNVTGALREFRLRTLLLLVAHGRGDGVRPGRARRRGRPRRPARPRALRRGARVRAVDAALRPAPRSRAGGHAQDLSAAGTRDRGRGGPGPGAAAVRRGGPRRPPGLRRLARERRTAPRHRRPDRAPRRRRSPWRPRC